MIEVTESDTCLICGETLAMHNRGTGLPTCRHIAVPTFRSAATHRTEAAKAERDRIVAWLREDQGGRGLVAYRHCWNIAEMVERGDHDALESKS